MNYDVRDEADRAASNTRISELMTTVVRGGSRDHLAPYYKEIDARLDRIFAFDVMRARAGDPAALARVESYQADNRRFRARGISTRIPVPEEPIRATPAPAPPDPRDAVLSAMRAMNKG